MRAAMLVWGLLGRLALGAGAAQELSAVELIITHANVRTMDVTRPQAEAVAIAGQHIAAVGARAQIEKLSGPGTRVIDTGGRLSLPACWPTLSWWIATFSRSRRLRLARLAWT